MAFSTKDEDGSIAHVVHRLVRWTLQAPRGIAYVAYTSEDARRIAESRWLDALREKDQAVEFLDLWSQRDVDEAVETLLGTIEARRASVLSVTGFGPLLDALGEDWRPLNYRREQWYSLGTRQIWWVPARFDATFARRAPDLYSWFLVKESLTEEAPGASPFAAESMRTAMVPTEAAKAAFRESDAAFRQFQEGLANEALPEDLLDLLIATAWPLFEAGHGAEGHQRATSLLDRLLASSSGQRLASLTPPALSSAIARAAVFFSNSTDYGLAQRLLTMLGEEAVLSLPPTLGSDVLRSLGDIALARSDYDMAHSRNEEALHLYRRAGNILGEAECIRNLGQIALLRSDFEKARDKFEVALSLYRQSGSLRGEANCIKALGNVALHRSDLDRARALFEEALLIYRRAGEFLGEVNCIRGLGEVALLRSEFDEARVRFQEALPIHRRIGDVLGEANCIRYLGEIALREEDGPLARSLGEQSLALYVRYGDPYSIGTSYRMLSHLPHINSSERQYFRAQAAAAWRSIGREDLVASYLSHTEAAA